MPTVCTLYQFPSLLEYTYLHATEYKIRYQAKP